MRRAGLQGIRRDRIVRTAVAGDKALCPLDHVKRQFGMLIGQTINRVYKNIKVTPE